MKILLTSFLISFLWSCKDQHPAISNCEDPASDAVPQEWLDQRIAQLRQDDYTAEIYQLKFKWGYGYFVNPCTQCADYYTYTYDKCGTLVCQSGGIAGTNYCPQIYQEDAEKKLIWKEN